jgi:hypothetical protein
MTFRYEVAEHTHGYFGDTDTEVKLWSYVDGYGISKTVWCRMTAPVQGLTTDNFDHYLFRKGDIPDHRFYTTEDERHTLMAHAIAEQNGALGCLALLGGGMAGDYIFSSSRGGEQREGAADFYLDLWYSLLEFTSCGLPGETLELVGEVLEAFQPGPGREKFTALEAKITDAAAYFIYLWLIQKEYADYGSAPPGNLTQKGFAFRELTRAAVAE